MTPTHVTEHTRCGGGTLGKPDEAAFVERVGSAESRRFEGRPVYQIGDKLAPLVVPTVEGVWRIGERTIVETAREKPDPKATSANPDYPLIEDSYVIAAPDRAWFVAFVAPAETSVERVRRFVKRLGFRAYWPRRVRMEMRRIGRKRERVPVPKALFPRYVLVHLPQPETPFGLLTSHEAKFNGLSGMVATMGHPIAVPDTLVKRIVEREREGEFSEVEKVVTKHVERTVERLPDWLDLGELAQIKDGPFASYLGVVEEIDAVKRVAKLCVEIFGRGTPVEVPIDGLAAIE